MIADQTELRPVAGAAGTAVSGDAAPSTILRRTVALASGLMHAAKALFGGPVLPYAALWEATLMADMLRDPEDGWHLP